MTATEGMQPQVWQTGGGVKYDPVATNAPPAEGYAPQTYGNWPPPQEMGNTMPQPQEMDGGGTGHGGAYGYGR